MKVEMIVERTKTGYSAYAKKYPVYTVGKNLSELKSRITEALNIYFHRERKKLTEKDIQVILDLPQFFEFYKVINASALSERIGMNQSLLAQYIHGYKKPSSAQVTRILNGVREIGKELASVSIVE